MQNRQFWKKNCLNLADLIFYFLFIPRFHFYGDTKNVFLKKKILFLVQNTTLSLFCRRDKYYLRPDFILWRHKNTFFSTKYDTGSFFAGEINIICEKIIFHFPEMKKSPGALIHKVFFPIFFKLFLV